MTGRSRLEALVAAPLRIGTLVAAVVIAFGLAVAWGDAPDPRTPDTRSLLDLFAEGGGRAAIGAGLLVLTLIPVATLVAALVGFVRGSERRYVTVTATVLGLLAASVVASALLT